MGCFTACFSSSNRSKTKLTAAATLSQDQNICHDREINEVLQCVYSNDEYKMKDSIAVISVIKETEEEEEENQSNNERKKVAYHSDMMMKSSSQKELNLLVDEEKEDKTMSGKSKDEEIVGATTDSSSSSLFTYPPNHRYHSCTTISDDDESEVTDFDKSKTDLVVDENASVGDDINSSDSLFSLSIDSKKKEISADNKSMEKEVNSPLKTSTSRRNCIHSVLNPIENLNQWRSVKEKTAALTMNDQEKENNTNNNKNLYLEQEKENLYQEFNFLHNNEDPILYLKQEKENLDQEFNFLHKDPFLYLKQEKENLDQEFNLLHNNEDPILYLKQEKENLDQEFNFLHNNEDPILYLEQEKENLDQEFNLLHNNNEDPILKKSKRHHENDVDTSFSSWIITSDKCRTNDNNSPVSVGNKSSEKTILLRSFIKDRPILGSLTLNELNKQESRSSIIDKSFDSNSNTHRTTSSNSEQYRKCQKKVNSTSFQTRIETALNTGSAED